MQKIKLAKNVRTLFIREFLPKEAGCPTFINANLIAACLAPFEPERAALRAGQLMLEEIFHHARRGQNFAFETTLSGKAYARLIANWQKDGYVIKLFFLRLASPELAFARVSPYHFNAKIMSLMDRNAP